MPCKCFLYGILGTFPVAILATENLYHHCSLADNTAKVLVIGLNQLAGRSQMNSGEVLTC